MNFGYIKDFYDSRDFLFYKVSSILRENSFKAPSKLSYRSSLTPAKDQGRLGSCVAFAATALKEWQEQKEHKSVKQYDLSEQWLYWNCKAIDNFSNTEGTTIRTAMKVLKNFGIPKESAWPYTDNKENKGEPDSWAYMTAKWKLISQYRRITNVLQLKESLASNGPVVAGVMVFPEFYSVGDDGIVSDPQYDSQVLGGHAILVCGYDDNKELFEFKNSWSSSWGDNGFGYLSYNFIRKYTMDIWAAFDKNVTISGLAGNIVQHV